MKNYLHPNPEYNFKVPQHIGEAIDELVQALRQASDGADAEVESDEAAEDRDDDGEPWLDDEVETPSEEETENEIVTPTMPTAPERSSRAPYFCPVVQPKLRKLLVALYMEQPEPQSDRQFFSVFMRYALLSSIRPKGEWKKSGQISQTIAALTFTGRLTLYSVMDDGEERPPNYQYVT